MISTSELESWHAWSGNEKMLVQTYLQFPTLLSWKQQLWFRVSGFESTPSSYYRTLTLKEFWFFYICWISSIKMSIDNFFLSARLLLYKPIAVCSVFSFCTTLTDNKAMRPGLLFVCCCFCFFLCRVLTFESKTFISVVGVFFPLLKQTMTRRVQVSSVCVLFDTFIECHRG